MNNCEKTEELEKQSVWKANKLVEARYKLNLNEQKFVLKSISMIKNDDNDFKNYIVTVSDFARLLNLEHTDTAYRDLKKISKSILKKPFSIREGDNEHQFNWFAKITYVHNRGHVILSHHPDLKPLLLEVKQNFTAYNLKYALSLPSVYAIRVYELLKQYQKLKKRIITLEDLKYFLGIEPGKYEHYGSFKRKVLNYVMREIEKHTDIKFTYEEIKKGRKVVAIKFIISNNKKNIKKRLKKEDGAVVEVTPEIIPETNDFEKIFALIPPGSNHYKTLPKIINDYLEKEGFDYVKANVEYSVKNSNSAFMGYLKIALKNNYAKKIVKTEEELKIIAAKKEAKRCYANPNTGCTNGVWSTYTPVDGCYWCVKFKEQKESNLNEIKKPQQDIHKPYEVKTKKHYQKFNQEHPTNAVEAKIIDKWHNVLDILEKQLPKHSYNMWLLPLTVDLVKSKNYRIVLICPNRFSRDRIENQFLPIIKKILRDGTEFVFDTL